jgi:hypothetical protein
VKPRGRELVAAARDVRIGGHDAQGDGGVEHVAGLSVGPRRVPVTDAHLAGQHEGLGPGAGLDQAAVDQQLVQALA